MTAANAPDPARTWQQARAGLKAARTGHQRSGGEEGSSTLELVLLTPLLIALVFGVIQAALLWNAQHLTSAAAQQGARVARTAAATQTLTLSGTPVAGSGNDPSAESAVKAETLSYLRQTGGHALTHPTVKVQRDGGYVTVTVTGTVLGVLPGTSVKVTAHSRTPLEGFRP